MLRAIYEFQAQDTGELSVRAGELLNAVYNSEEAPEGWMLVESMDTGGEGYVPSEYVQEIQHLAPSSIPDTESQTQSSQIQIQVPSS